MRMIISDHEIELICLADGSMRRANLCFNRPRRAPARALPGGRLRSCPHSTMGCKGHQGDTARDAHALKVTHVYENRSAPRALFLQSGKVVVCDMKNRGHPAGEPSRTGTVLVHAALHQGPPPLAHFHNEIVDTATARQAV
jgi:hypothetical protein